MLRAYQGGARAREHVLLVIGLSVGGGQGGPELCDHLADREGPSQEQRGLGSGFMFWGLHGSH